MKRALAILAACSLFGFAGLAQVSGEWDTTINVLPTLGLEETSLTLTYTFAGWDLTSISTFDSTGFVSQSFEAVGALGPTEIEASIAFAPGEETIYECGSEIWTVPGPHYKSSSLEASLEFGGVSFSFAVTHDADYVAIFTEDEIQTNGSELSAWTSDCYDKYLLVASDGYYCQTDSEIALWLPSYMTYTLTVEADPISAEIVFDDVCTGIQFKEATIGFADLSLCCGITFDAELAFNKCEGFDYFEFTAKDLFPICCGISFDLSVKFTTTAKTVTLEPKWAGISGCFEFYGDLAYTGGENEDLYLNGLRIDGFKIRCDLAECNYVEFVTFLSPEYADDYGYEDVFEGTEFEYIELGFCGPGCCGGNYSVDLSVFFDAGGGLFGISRVGADMSIPVMSNFTLNTSFGVTTAGDTTLDIGWTFTF